MKVRHSTYMLLSGRYPDSKVRVAHMGPTWVLSAPGRPHVGPINLVIRVVGLWHAWTLSHGHNITSIWPPVFTAGYTVASDCFTNLLLICLLYVVKISLYALPNAHYSNVVWFCCKQLWVTGRQHCLKIYVLPKWFREEPNLWNWYLSHPGDKYKSVLKLRTIDE